jgi:acyl carrier protein
MQTLNISAIPFGGTICTIMSNLEIYNRAFREALDIAGEIDPDLSYQSIVTWDSVGHMTLMAGLEEAFSITFEMDDIIDFSSYLKGQEILRKYGVAF